MRRAASATSLSEAQKLKRMYRFPLMGWKSRPDVAATPISSSMDLHNESESLESGEASTYM